MLIIDLMAGDLIIRGDDSQFLITETPNPDEWSDLFNHCNLKIHYLYNQDDRQLLPAVLNIFDDDRILEIFGWNNEEIKVIRDGKIIWKGTR